MTVSFFILTLFLITDPIPICDLFPTTTLPPEITPGPQLEKSKKYYRDLLRKMYL